MSYDINEEQIKNILDKIIEENDFKNREKRRFVFYVIGEEGMLKFHEAIKNHIETTIKSKN
jgi:hypothetical protein